MVFELSPGTQVGTNKYGGLTISQFIYTSNTANIPLRDPNASTRDAVDSPRPVNSS